MKDLIRQKPIILILFVFGVIYSLISLPDHYLFRTYALDLGMLNHAVYCFSILEPNYFTLDIAGYEVNYLGDHFSPVTILLSPFRYLFGTYCLLVIQIVSVLVGGIGIYNYSGCSFDRKASSLFTVHFFSIWGIYSALAFEYHSNVLAAMLLPWLFYFHEKEKKGWIALIVVLMLICKENMGLWLVFVFGSLILKQLLKSPIKLRPLKSDIFFMLASAAYFLAVVLWIMPFFQGSNPFTQMTRYTYLGNSPSEILALFFHDPFHFLSLFFQSPFDDPMTYGIKAEFYLMLLFSGGIFLLFRPYYLVMLFPVIAWKMLSWSYPFWSINGHYSIEVVPIISIGVIEFFKKMEGRKLYLGLIAVILCTGFFTFRSMEGQRTPWYDKTNVAFYSKIHYHTPLDVNEVKQALKIIPDNAVISVSGPIAPHLAFRQKIYHYPVIKDAEYIALLLNGMYYPLTASSFYMETAKIYNRNGFKVIYSSGDLLILKRQ